ncbi:hypothetical protein CL651_003280 [bacterium]|nr:hypothetical protein [bacterium]|tara:strand:- start:4715 stop:4864 length:150 start_codon:yes stop_codon:yes gene_type:complete
MDKNSDRLGTAGAIGFAVGVFGFISTLLIISFLGPFLPDLIRKVFGVIN